jgi:hypothetical protein
VFYGDNFYRVIDVAEADAIVADAETESWRLDAPKPLDVPSSVKIMRASTCGMRSAVACSLFDRAEACLSPTFAVEWV